MLIKAEELKQVDQDYRVHQQAFLNFSVKAEKKTGKHKSKPVYSTFKKFFDYEKALDRVKNQSSRFSGIGKFLKKGE